MTMGRGVSCITGTLPIPPELHTRNGQVSILKGPIVPEEGRQQTPSAPLEGANLQIMIFNGDALARITPWIPHPISTFLVLTWYKITPLPEIVANLVPGILCHVS